MEVTFQLRSVDLGRTEGTFPQACPSRIVLDHVTSKWGVLVLLALMDGTMRWSELKRAVEGVSEKMLAATLRTLEQDGFVVRVVHPVVPPHVEYSLSDLGRGMGERLLPLMDFIVEHAETIVSSPGA